MNFKGKKKLSFIDIYCVYLKRIMYLKLQLKQIMKVNNLTVLFMVFLLFSTASSKLLHREKMNQHQLKHSHLNVEESLNADISNFKEKLGIIEESLSQA